MDKIFSKLTRKTVECYVDNIVVKSRRKGDHLQDLRKVFDLMRTHQLKMNPTKSFLGVSSGKFLGFVVTSKGIHLDPEKVSAIRDMKPLGTSKSPEDCKESWPISGVSSPDQACQDAFDEIKYYLTTPPVMVPP